MIVRAAGLATLLLVGCGEEPRTAQAAASQEPSAFLRFRKTDADNGFVETAVTGYRNADGVRVDLIAAVHIADAAHYRELQKAFTAYDSVLYELVAHPDDRPSPGGAPRGGLSFVQRAMANGFELRFQLDGIDYAVDNFVHADLTPEQFVELQEERGESLVTLLLRAMQAAMAEANRLREQPAEGGTELDLVSAFRAGYGRHTLRMLFADQLEQVERMAAGFAGPDGESALVEGRNRRAVEVLAERIDAGDRRLAIYYGAAHMPDFERRLRALGFDKTGERWLVAWDVRKRKDRTRGTEPEDGGR